MRKTFTIGIQHNGDAVILKDHRASLREHKAALVSDEYKGEFSDVFVLESSKASKKRRNISHASGGVNFHAARRVAVQKKRGLDDKIEQPDRGNSEGKVNFDAAQTVAEQTGRKRVSQRKRKKLAKAAAPTAAAAEKAAVERAVADKAAADKAAAEKAAAAKAKA